MAEWEENMRSSYDDAGQNVDLRTLIAGEDLTNDVLKTESRYSYFFYETAGNKENITTGPGFLHALTIGTAGSASYVIIRDSLTAGAGNVIAVVDTNGRDSIIFDVEYSVGLTLEVTGTPKITVSAR